jgi:phosphatidylserine/phosphatidylglycerophosphate/cardiolipin synthase-like enzyme
LTRARDLADFYASLPSSEDPFSPSDAARLAFDPRAAPLAAALGSLTGHQILQLCLQTMRVRDEDLTPHLVDAEFVATLPGFLANSARSTAQVIREMLESAGRSVIALGYEISDSTVIGHIHETARRADITLICDRSRGSGPALLETWPSNIPRPRIFQECVRDDASAYASMHGKALLVDGHDLLLTSANFTFHGLHGNIELGVRLRGGPARRAVDVFSEILRSGLVEQVML